jgi:predicted aminopeptidase
MINSKEAAMQRFRVNYARLKGHLGFAGLRPWVAEPAASLVRRRPTMSWC